MNRGLPCGDGGGSEEGGEGPAAARRRTLGKERQPRPREIGEAAAAAPAVVDGPKRRRGGDGRSGAKSEKVDADVETTVGGGGPGEVTVAIGGEALGGLDGEERSGCGGCARLGSNRSRVAQEYTS